MSITKEVERPHMVTVRMSATEFRAVRELAQETGIGVSSLLRQGLRLAHRQLLPNETVTSIRTGGGAGK